jgi:hypothetical protein
MKRVCIEIFPEVRRNGAWKTAGEVFSNPEYRPDNRSMMGPPKRHYYTVWATSPIDLILTKLCVREGWPDDADADTVTPAIEGYRRESYQKVWLTLEGLLEQLESRETRTTRETFLLDLANYERYKDEPVISQLVFVNRRQSSSLLMRPEVVRLTEQEYPNLQAKDPNKRYVVLVERDVEDRHWGEIEPGWWEFVRELKQLGAPEDVRILFDACCYYKRRNRRT